MSELRYRADIEGLRSIAILPILLFHAGFTTIRGGFAGVDIFFVISGYLITSILYREVGAGNFSLLRFYQRRVARILPPLFVMLAAVLIAASLVQLPDDIAAIGRSVAAAAGFVSNIYFWSEVSYFARAAESQPLLHTWSLGVEEQFYIFFPLLLFALDRLAASRLRLTLGIIGAVSLAGGIYLQRISPSSDFYLLPTRTWELLLGSLVAVGAFPKFAGAKFRAFLSIAAAGAILAGLAFTTTWMPFPSPLAILPCLGTAMLIAYGEDSVGRVLALPPLRWIGRISYSLYLWHWPIITFYRETYGATLDMKEAALLIAASVAAGAASYYLVERPFTPPLRKMPASRAVAIGLAGVLLFVALGLGMSAVARSWWPISPEVERVAAYADYRAGKGVLSSKGRPACFIQNRTDVLDRGVCLVPQPGVRNVLLLGDSHAQMYGTALRERFPNIHFLQATSFGCPPIENGSHIAQCNAMVREGLEEISRKVQGVVLVSRWRADQADRLGQTLRSLKSKGVDVTVIGPVLEYDGTYPTMLARAILNKDVSSVARFKITERRATDAILRGVTAVAGAKYYSAYEAECPRDRCRLFSTEGEPMHFDYGHLTDSGALDIISSLPRP